MKTCAIVSAVYDSHVDLLGRTLATFALCEGYELHAFVFGERQPRQPVAGIHYHHVPFTGDYGPEYREINYRRWQVIDAFDRALVVDGGDTYCVCPLPPIDDVLEGRLAAASVEHMGSRRLGRSFTSTYFNAGVTFWDVNRSRALRQAILDRGRIRFRAKTDDQLTLNEVLHSRIQDVRILPFLFNYHLHLRPRRWSRAWPVATDLSGVYILHTPDAGLVSECLPANPEAYPLVPLATEESPPRGVLGRLRQLVFRLRHKC